MEPDERAVDFDGFWKAALDLYVRPLVAFVAPEVDALVDWKAGIEPLDKELAALSPGSVAGRRFVDKLVQVRRIDGGASILLIHVEIQGTRDRSFEARMFTYWSRILRPLRRRPRSRWRYWPTTIRSGGRAAFEVASCVDAAPALRVCDGEAARPRAKAPTPSSARRIRSRGWSRSICARGARARRSRRVSSRNRGSRECSCSRPVSVPRTSERCTAC
jgi:hypothetical protein